MAVRATRFIVWGVALLIVAALVYALQPQPLEADFVTIDTGPLRVTLDEEGETRVRDRFMVSAPLAGRVLRIELEPGDPVTANETILATFLPVDPTLLDARTRAEIEARVRAAESAVGRAEVERDRAQTESEFADSDLERYQHLDASELISKEQLDAVRLRARTAAETPRSADFAVSNARYELEVAQASLLQAQGGGSGGQTITLRSPIAGVVLQRLRASEAIVPPGEPLMEIADPAQLEIVSDYLSTDAVRIRRGQSVLIEQWGGDRTLAGRVRRVESFGFTKISALGVEEQRVNVVIDFEDVREAWEALGDGYRVEVRVVTWDEGDVLKVPTSSLFRDGDVWAVYAVTLNTATLTQVEIGQRNGLEAQIVSGLSAGDQVIAYPSDAIADGVEVVARD
jgi:HlyD family secretion protein